uniref:Uncharacterized protein n=1 Tax=Rhinolophus ferrumequinum TaxID=59479 RepID=A0A671ESS8_RHIFE
QAGLVIKSLLVLSLLRNWNKWWLVFQLAHRSLSDLQCIISSIIVPHCFQGKCVPTFHLDFKMSGTDLLLKEPPDSGRATFPLRDLAWPPASPCFTRRCHCQGEKESIPEHHPRMKSYSCRCSCKTVI